MPLIETDAVVLRTYKLADADKIALALTATNGMVRGVARGARRLKSRFGAGLEPFTLVSLQYFEKENKELVSIRQADILRSYFSLLSHENAFQTLEYISQLTIEFSPLHDPNPVTFRMVRAVLEALAEDPTKYRQVLKYFEIWLLKLNGLWPDLSVCVRCGQTIGGQAFYRTGQGVYCITCAPAATRPLTTEVLAKIAAAQRQPPAAFSATLTAAEIDNISEITQSLIARALEKDLNQRPLVRV